jgi:molecular chaperone GrpE (heat shock protein)
MGKGILKMNTEEEHDLNNAGKDETPRRDAETAENLPIENETEIPEAGPSPEKSPKENAPSGEEEEDKVDLRDEPSGGEMGSIAPLIKELRNGLKELKDALGDIKDEPLLIEELREELKELKDELGDVKDELKKIKEGTEEYKDKPGGDVPLSEGHAKGVDGHVDDLSRGIAALSDKMDFLNKLFTQKIQSDDREKKIADNLHEELQKYKQGLYSSIMKPLIHEIVSLREDMAKVSAGLGAKPIEAQNIPLRAFDGLVMQVETILENYDVEIYKSKPGDDFVPLRQKAAARVATDDPSMDKKIAESLGSGYAMDDKSIFPEKVKVFVYEKPEKNATE